MKETLSVIIPVYGEKELVPILYNRLISVLKELPVEYNIIYVNDACPYGSGDELDKIAQIDNNVTIINFSRNFGEATAVKAGIDNCDSDWAVIMDCDLQDNPKDIINLYNKAKEGYQVVWGERIDRHDNIMKKFLSNSFYFISNIFSEIKIDKKIGSFSIISKEVISELKLINTYSFNYIQMVEYLGFNKAYIPIVKEKRELGKSAYSLFKATKLATMILVSSSSKPLLIPIFSSVLLFLICILGIGYHLFECIRTNSDFFSEYSITILLILFLFGILFINLSILFVYVNIILKEILKVPHYVIKKRDK